MTGYVLDVGPQFFLLALVDENIRFNGFLCLRLKDVRHLEIPPTYAAFIEAALNRRGERTPKNPGVKVGSVQELLGTAGRAFPVITIHREAIDPSVCRIGRLVELTDDSLSLLEIGPDACWDEAPLRYRTREITRIDFGGGYEEALVLVGGIQKRPTTHRSPTRR
jgi:hypothetical protein